MSSGQLIILSSFPFSQNAKTVYTHCILTFLYVPVWIELLTRHVILLNTSLHSKRTSMCLKLALLCFQGLGFFFLWSQRGDRQFPPPGAETEIYHLCKKLSIRWKAFRQTHSENKSAIQDGLTAVTSWGTGLGRKTVVPQVSILIGLNKAVHYNKWVWAPNIRKQML